MAPIIREEWGIEWDDDYNRNYENAFGKQGEILVAVFADRMAGYVWFNMDSGCEEAFIQSIQVLKAFQRRGIGSDLMRYVEEEARNEARTEIILCVQCCNSAARGFYQALGFEECLRTGAGLNMRKLLLKEP